MACSNCLFGVLKDEQGMMKQAAPAAQVRRPRYLNLLVFVAGMVTLGMELSGARLLDPWFGNSILVWAALIGLVLACLSLGYWLGGRVADRRPEAAHALPKKGQENDEEPGEAESGRRPAKRRRARVRTAASSVKRHERAP